MTFMKFIKIFNLREECPVVYLAVHIGFLAKFQWRFVCCNRFHNTIRTAYHSLRFQVSTTRKVVWFHVTTFEKGMKRRGSCQIGLDFQRLEWMKSMLYKKIQSYWAHPSLEIPNWQKVEEASQTLTVEPYPCVPWDKKAKKFAADSIHHWYC